MKLTDFEKAQALAAAIVTAARLEAPEGFDPRAEATPPNLAAEVEKVRSSISRMVVGLNGLNVPESLKPLVTSLSTDFNSLLTKLSPLDAHKAAGDANYALNSISYAMNSLQDTYERACNTLTAMAKNCSDAMNAKESAMNGLVTTGVDTEITRQIAAGTLFKKDIVDGLVQTARTQGRDTALNGLQILTARKGKLAELKLPLPENEAVLEGDDAAFNTLTSTASNRIATLAGKGLSLNNSPDLVKRLAYSATFESDFKNVLDTLKAQQGGNGGAGGAGGAGGEGGAGGGEKKKPKFVL